MNISELYRASGLAPVQNTPANQGAAVHKGAGPGFAGPDFNELLSRELNVSSHAATRIKSRQLPWDAALEKRISDGIDTASSKGSRQSLILADNVAVIANVQSRTVVTAMNRDQLRGRIFTNIDSAVLV
ncbi:MAG: flagellar protein [Deltaproteobacteria bacterium]|nr:flagellar protein [Deltaproteobacteria bacterium]